MSIESAEQIWTEESEPKTLREPSMSNVLVLTQQEGAERLARDINTKINDLEQHIGRLGDLFGQSQTMIKSSFDNLQICNAGLTTELDRVAQRMAHTAMEQSELTRSLDLRLEQSSNHQAEMTRALEDRFHQTIALLGGQWSQADETLKSQQLQLDVLHTEQNELLELQQKLAAQSDEQNRAQHSAIEALAAETGKKIQINKTHIEGLNALHREQQKSLSELIRDLDQLEAHADRSDERMDGFEAVTVSRWLQTNKHFRITAGVGAGVTVLMAALVAYLFVKPAALPETVETQLTELASSVGQQGEGAQAMASDMARLRQDMKALQLLVSAGGQDVTSLRAGQTETAEELLQLQAMLNSVQRNMDSLQSRLDGGSLKAITPSLALNDARWVAARDNSHFTIQLVGVYRFPGLVSYINQHASSLKAQPLSFNKSQHLGRDWFNLYYGDFASMAEARVALASLPESLLGNKPWIRGMKSVQASASQ